MGSGSWSSKSFTAYSCSLDRDVDTVTGAVKYSSSTTAQDIYKQHTLAPELDPKGVTRECVDSEEHPNTLPVILALDVTGSMGQAAVEVSKQLNVIMTNLYKEVKDVEFCIMGIGDFAYDHAPLQVSQFESDIRIAEQLDKVYFEFGGGGNSFESYTASWYFGVRHCKLDCWKRGQKGIIITMGDEQLNPYIPTDHNKLYKVIGDTPQADIETPALYAETKEKFNIYHIDVRHDYYHDDGIRESFEGVIGSQHFFESSIDDIATVITNIIKDAAKNSNNTISFAKSKVEEPANTEGQSAIFDNNISW